MCFKELKVALKTGSHFIIGDFRFHKLFILSCRAEHFLLFHHFSASVQTDEIEYFYENKLIIAKQSRMLLIIWLKQIMPFVKH